MEKVFQVFVSSTFSDLADERRQVTNTLAKAGYIAAGMELFPATDQQQLDFIKRVIDRSDYYVVIVAGRYGSLADDKLSYTEHEYEYARSKGIPVLAFLHGDTDKIEIGKTDKDPKKAKNLELFRTKLSTGRLVDFWTSPQDLCIKVLTAVVQTTNLFPRTGWVRGDQAIDPKLLQELERTRIENEQLKVLLAETRDGRVIFPDDISGPDEIIALKIYDGHERKIVGELLISFKEIFVSLFEMFVQQNSESEICRHIGEMWCNKHNVKRKPGTYANHTLTSEHCIDLRSHLEALGLIQSTGRTRQYEMFGTLRTETFLTWSISERGRKYMASLRAMKRSETT